jgi:hypothetical protein
VSTVRTARTDVRWLAAVALAILSIIAVVVLTVAQPGGRTAIVVRGRRGPLTEQEHVQLSQQALAAVVKEFRDYEPRPYDHDALHLFAPNLYNTNDGYVLWVHKTRAEQGFRVAMEVKGSNVVCQVIPFK